MDPLPWPDQQHLNATEGWLELGNPAEAALEFEQVDRLFLAHPAVLDMRWQLEAHARHWTACLEIARTMTRVIPDSPAGWIHLSYALHEMRRTQEAWDNLVKVSERFEENPTIVYNLACYACQLGDMAAARRHLKLAISRTTEPKHMRLQAMQDPDLKPLFKKTNE